MFARLLILAVASFAFGFNHSPLWAQQESKSWLPRIFSSDDDKASGGFTTPGSSSTSKSASDSSWWTPWKSDSKPKAKSSKTNGSMIGRMGRTTKKWWSNSLDFVNPFNDAPKPKQPNGYAPQNNTKKTGGGLFGWMAPEEDKEIRSVNDFLSLPMPE